MANVVEIVVQGTDATNPGFKRATENTKQLSREMKGFGAVLSQTGSIAAAFGNHQLASVVTQFESAIVGARGMTNELGKSKAAVVALGAAATAGGAAIGNFLRPWIPFFNEPDKLNAALDTMQKIQQVQSQRLALRDPSAGQIAQQRADTERQIKSLERFDPLTGQVRLAATKEEEELIFQLRQLQAERETKLESDKEKQIGEMVRNSKIEELAFYSEHLGAKAAEDARYQDNLSRLRESQILNEEEKNSLIEQEEFNHQLRLSTIHQQAQDKILADDRARKARMIQLNETYAAATATIFGNLASAAAAFGKKGFAAFKAFRIAEAIASTYAGAARALADWPWPYSIAVAASVVAAGIANVATIAASKPSGQAHAGMTSIPGNGDQTWMLQGGERIVSKNQNEDLTDMLEGRGPSSSPAIHVSIDGFDFFRLMKTASMDGRLQISSRAIV